MTPCLELLLVLLKNRLKTPASSVPICRALPLCSIPGDDRSSIIHTYTSSARQEDFRPIEQSGCLPTTPSICRSKRFPKSSGPNSKDEMAKRGLLHKIDASCWQIAWNINCQPIGDSEATLKYLAPYIFRVTISDSRIVAVKDRMVTFSYEKKGSNRNRKTTLDVIKFILTLSPACSACRPYEGPALRLHEQIPCTVSITRLRLLILTSLKISGLSLTDLSTIKPKPALPKPICPTCGGILLYLFSLIPGRPCRGPT